MKKVCMIGSGYVGLVSGACIANLGNKVIFVDKDLDKIKKLNNNIIPIYEPGLEELLLVNKAERRVTFTDSVAKGVKESDIIFIAVDTPVVDGGEVDLSKVEDVSEKIAKNINGYKVIVMKSTVPVNTCKFVKEKIKKINKSAQFDIVSNPEFLREGEAVLTFIKSDRVVIGSASQKATSFMVDLYKPLNTPFIITDIESAELIKLCSNAFLSTKISFINAISQICEKTGADITKVAKGLGMDKRIGEDFLSAGVGFGGFCLPKDNAMLMKIFKNLDCDYSLLKAVIDINAQQRINICAKAEKYLKDLRGKTIAVLGLSFKPNTDDLRGAPSIDIINRLKQKGAKIRAYDPKCMEMAKKIIKGAVFCKDVYDAVKKVDALLLVTEWAQFRNVDLMKIKHLMKRPLVIDGRNFYDINRMKNMGFEYYGTGRQ